MSRADKRYRVVHEEKNIRLFAFNNFVNGYRPQHHLDEPAIILRTRIKKDDEHPALQWQPLAQQILARKPMTHSTYVMDATRLDATMEQDEITHRGVEGPLLKRMANLISKLMPKRAQLVGAGTTAEIVAKTAICCSTLKGMIGKVVLVCPSLAEVQRSVESAEKRLQQQGHKVALDNEGKPAVEAVVVLDAANAHLGPQWEQLLGKSFRVTINKIPAGTSLFGAIATAVIPEQREECPTEGSRCTDLRCYMITFMLSMYTKQPEQEFDLSPVTENPNLPPAADDDEDEDPDNMPDAGNVEESALPSSEARYNLADLFNVKNATVRFEGNVVDGKTVANVHGLIELDELVPELSEVEAGTTVVLSAQLSRDEDGRTMLKTSTIANLSTGLPSTYFACGTNFPTLNYSAIKQYYGAALIRGRKLVLCRSLEGIWRGMRMPHRPHCESYLTPYEAAAAAISDQCDVSEDNFYFHPAIAPVTYYPSGEKGACVTLFIAVATNISDGGVEDDSKELLEQLHDGYDWYSFRAASAKLPTKAERDALVDVRRNVQRAFEAGLYTPMAGHGVFGEDIPAAEGYSYDAPVEGEEAAAAPVEEGEESSAAVATAPITVAGNGINVTDLLVMQDPFAPLSAKEAAAVARIEPSRVKEWSSERADGDWVGIVGGKGCVVLQPSHDMDIFAQQELPPALPEDCPPSVRVVVAAKADDIEAAFVAPIAAVPPPAAKLMACLEYADALMCRGGSSAFTPLVQNLLKAMRPELQCIAEDQLPLLVRGELPADVTPAVPQPCPHFLNIPLRAKTPFHPEKLHALLTGSSTAALARQWGCEQILWISGSAWLSTSPLHKVTLTVGGGEGAITVAKASPWWCCVEEGDRPEGLDTSDWDQLHGSRRQELNVLVTCDPSQHAAVTAAVRAELMALLCPSNDYRHWHRLDDPFKL